MPKEISAGAVVFRKEGGQPFYLLLHYPSGSRVKREYWDFPKGHIEKGETEIETVKREVQEETGVKDLMLLNGFKETISYMFQAQGQKIFKTVVFFLGETRLKDVKISQEHLAYIWLPFDKALLKLKFPNAKKLLKKANNLIFSLPQ
ncbi:MAG: NUDIX hydrolase [Parcubacteria group bacterium Greene0714_21]|nr:MAG: NUDIX hydrolase [Parcubacteria group bacterium Greene0416_39]TSC97334.1 MAG: NUDIX hydrolase [Parcubacteria group bacterium Greene1014_47]TSD03939.1 MAG: NUDIX hydrolase [Parcubacteria group bacterium Greene0714_21]